MKAFSVLYVNMIYRDISVAVIFRADAMIRIQDSLRSRKPGEAVALFRAARYSIYSAVRWGFPLSGMTTNN